MQTINTIFEYDIVSIVNYKVVSTIPMTRLLDILLYGKVDLPLDKNIQILKAVLKYIVETKRFNRKVWMDLGRPGGGVFFFFFEGGDGHGMGETRVI